MEKEEKPIFLKIFAIILITLVVEALAIFYAASRGFPIPTIMIIFQIPLILFVLIFAYVRNRKIWQRKVDEYGINFIEISKKSKTDLDALYTILKGKKEISVRSVSNLFKISEDLAMEWSRILESGNLATIEYPGFGSPKVIYKELEKKVTLIPDQRKKEMKKEDSKTKSKNNPPMDKGKKNLIKKKSNKKKKEKSNKKASKKNKK